MEVLPPAIQSFFVRPARTRIDECMQYVRERFPKAVIESTPEGPRLLVPGSYDRLFAAEAWEAMITRGLVSETANDHAHRAFARSVSLEEIENRGFSTCINSYPIEEHATPLRLFDALLLASDWNNLLTAEQLAHELAFRMQPWNGNLPDRIVWRVLDASVLRSTLRASANVQPWYYFGILAQSALDEPYLAPDEDQSFTLAKQKWERAKNKKLPLSQCNQHWVRKFPLVCERRADEIEPVFDLWEALVKLGYYFGGFGGAKGKTIVLLAPRPS